MARKVAACCEFFNVRTAWHGPGNVSPVGQAVNMHLDLTTYNFGIQEQTIFSAKLREVFPAHPRSGLVSCTRMTSPVSALTSTRRSRPSPPTGPQVEIAESIAAWTGPSCGHSKRIDERPRSRSRDTWSTL
jgi:hypothetical protein